MFKSIEHDISNTIINIIAIVCTHRSPSSSNVTTDSMINIWQTKCFNSCTSTCL